MSAYNDLTPAQQQMFNKVHEDAIWSDEPVTQSIPRLIGELDTTAEDRAAIAEAFMPGTGTVFLR